MSIRKEIEEYAKQIDIDKIGFCKADPFMELENIYTNRKKMQYMCSSEEIKELEKKIYPEKTLKGAKSFIVIIEGYNVIEAKNSDNDVIYGSISPASICEDYHKILYRKLEKLQNFILNSFDCNSKYFCDISPFSDKAIAIRAGLGTISKNSLLMTKEFGTRCFIGYILTDLEIETYDEPLVKNICSNCNICQKKCPTDSILGNGQLNSNRCISYLTQSKNIDDDLKNLMGNNIYGCDICQQVCPANKNIKYKDNSKIIDVNCNIEKLLNITNREFRETYGMTSSGWKGKKMLQRNAIIALSNDKSDKSIKLLESIKDDEREDIKKEVELALKKRNR